MRSNRPRVPVNLAGIMRATDDGSFRIANMRSRLKHADTDHEKDKRLARHECRWCYYFTSAIGGAAMTTYTCSGPCRAEKTHGSTATPILCDDCAEELMLCVRCGADIDGDEKRKRAPDGQVMR